LDKDLVPPNDGCGGAITGNFHFPFDVAGLAPGHWRIGGGSRTVLKRATPLRPVFTGDGGRYRSSGQNNGGCESAGKDSFDLRFHFVFSK
jgi:hypothetical protein